MNYIVAPTSDYLAHSAKGSEWKKHKYIKKADGKYYYPNSYEGGRHLPNDEKSSNKEKNHTSYNNTIEKISDLTGMKEESIDELITIAETKGFDSDEYKEKCQILSEGDPDMYNRINRILMADVITDDKESLNDYTKRMAEKVVNGEFGDGEERKEALGYNYERVQTKANEIIKKENEKKQKARISKNYKSLKHGIEFPAYVVKPSKKIIYW